MGGGKKEKKERKLASGRSESFWFMNRRHLNLAGLFSFHPAPFFCRHPLIESITLLYCIILAAPVRRLDLFSGGIFLVHA